MIFKRLYDWWCNHDGQNSTGEEKSNAPESPVEVGSCLHMCYHEAGHIETAYLHGASVTKVVAGVEGKSPHATVAHKSLSTKQPVGCGGYAAEMILYKAGRLVDDSGIPLTASSFEKQAMQNARLDKRPFYLTAEKDPATGLFPNTPFQPTSSWDWPAASDGPFKDYAELNILPPLLNRFSVVEALALELNARGLLVQADIEAIRDGFGVIK